MSNFKILRAFTGTGAVFFPAGKTPKGTCEFATNVCIKNCYQEHPKWPDYDEEILIPNKDKKRIYDVVTTMLVDDLYDIFVKELDGLQTPILHWFGSGDCLNKDIEYISSIITRIKKNKSIIQMGFTRNIKLWDRHKDVFALSIDNKTQILGPGIYSIPRYEKETNEIYSPTYQVKGGLCGPVSCDDIEDPALSHYINCRTCLRMKTGCYDRR